MNLSGNVYTFPVVKWEKFLLVAVFFTVLTIPFPSARGADIPPEFKQAIQRGVNYLKKNGIESGGEGSLAAYAMMVGGETPNNPKVKKILDGIAAKVENGVYKDSGNHFYEAGVDMMALEAADPVKYLPEMQAISDYIIASQKSHGGWFYPGRGDHGGDTSISQYSILALWAAARSGIAVPPIVWNQAANWHSSNQLTSGAFTYHPPEVRPQSFHALTMAGMGSLHICRLFLFPERTNASRPKKVQKKSKDKFGGVLVAVDLDSGVPESPAAEVGPTVSVSVIDGSINKGSAWYRANYDNAISAAQWPFYYLYALERMATLGDLEKINGHDWYREGGAHLLKTQQEDGSWNHRTGKNHNTAFAILFLARATRKIVGPPPVPPDPIGGGIMRGGSELTKVEDFSKLKVRNGEIVVEKNLGELDDLLAELSRARPQNVASTTDAIVESIQLGDREKLVGQKERLLKLVKHPQPGVRRVALWALARTADFEDVSVVLKLLDDPNIDVVIEAHNALRWINRNPRGIGMPNTPLAGLPEDATQEQKEQAFKKWHEEVKKRWNAWYLKVRPYEERNDLQELKTK